MSAFSPNGAYNGSAGGSTSGHTLTALGRWSVLNKQLPGEFALAEPSTGPARSEDQRVARPMLRLA